MISLGFKTNKKNLNFISQTPLLLEEMDIPLCDVCKSQMQFIIQVSTPMQDYNRILYVYSCKDCSSKDRGWRVFRQNSSKTLKNPIKKATFIEFQDIIQENHSSTLPKGKIDRDEGDWTGEKYEKQSIQGYSKEFKKFSQFVAEYPTQIIRYEWNGSPLYYSKPKLDSKVNNCQNCGSKRVFEFQLMPFLHSFVDSDSGDLKDLKSSLEDWETVIIYSCLMDCSLGMVSEEVAIVQGDLN